jgi:hypothetical protein
MVIKLTQDDIKRLIKYGKSYIYDFDPVENDELYRELLFDPLEDYWISVMVSYKESTMYWNEFEKDAWWVGFEKKKTGKFFNKLKAIHSYEKSYMKDYEYKYSYYFLAPFAFVFIIGPLIAVAISIPMGINESKYYLVPVFIWGGILLSMCVVLIPYTLYVNKRKIKDQLFTMEELKSYDYQEVINHLDSIKQFNENGIYIDYDRLVPLSDFDFDFYAFIQRSSVRILLIVFSKEYGEHSYEMDKYIYAYIKENNLLENNKAFRIFDENPENFMNILFKKKTTKNFKLSDNLGGKNE